MGGTCVSLLLGALLQLLGWDYPLEQRCMVHEISFNEAGEAEAVFAGTPAWHGLGTVVPRHLTVQAALGAAGLDWSVNQLPVFYQSLGDRTLQPVDTHVANVRSDDGRFLGVVGKQYVPVQHREQAELVETLVGEGEAVVECLAALRGGRRQAWVLAVPQELRIGSEDRIKRYLVACNAHDGSLAFRLFWSGVRVVCANTLRLALRDADSGVSLRHVGDVRGRITEARRVLGLARLHFEVLGEHLSELAEVAIEDAEAAALFAEVIPFPDQASRIQRERVEALRAQLLANFRSGAGHELAGPTLHGAFQAVAEFSSHQRPWRGRTALERAEKRFQGLVLGGPGQALQQRAFEAACRRLAA